jgi:hypothetical protein
LYYNYLYLINYGKNMRHRNIVENAPSAARMQELIGVGILTPTPYAASIASAAQVQEPVQLATVAASFAIAPQAQEEINQVVKKSCCRKVMETCVIL